MCATYDCSISGNLKNLRSTETGFVKATEVQGASMELGAKVVFRGREMTVIHGVNCYGELKMVDLSGITALADALKANAALTSLKCAAPRQFPNCQQPLILCAFLVCSVGTFGTYQLDIWGAKCFAEALKVNNSITSIKCAKDQDLPN